MSKRTFRQQSQPQTDSQTAPQPNYPQFEAFAPSRRQFLARLGAAVLGAGALGALIGCGDRPFEAKPDGNALAGAPPMPDAGLDGQPDPDIGEVPMGAKPMPDAGLDLRRDAEVLQGDPPMPDAAIDGRRDSEVLAGVPAQPDAGTDLQPWMGEAPLPDAGSDRR